MIDDKMREAFEAKLCPYRGSPDPWVVWQVAWQAATQAQTLAEAQQRGREIAAGIAKCVEKGDRMDDEPLFVYEHTDGRRITCRADDARLVGEPAWHRVGPVDAPTDAERLDFMVRECAWIVWTKRDGSIRQCQLWTQDSDELIHIVSGESRFFNTARDAIDAAMRATPPATSADGVTS